jgi:hypothetical protein
LLLVVNPSGDTGTLHREALRTLAAMVDEIANGRDAGGHHDYRDTSAIDGNAQSVAHRT